MLGLTKAQVSSPRACAGTHARRHVGCWSPVTSARSRGQGQGQPLLPSGAAPQEKADDSGLGVISPISQMGKLRHGARGDSPEVDPAQNLLLCLLGHATLPQVQRAALPWAEGRSPGSRG